MGRDHFVHERQKPLNIHGAHDTALQSIVGISKTLIKGAAPDFRIGRVPHLFNRFRPLPGSFHQRSGHQFNGGIQVGVTAGWRQVKPLVNSAGDLPIGHALHILVRKANQPLQLCKLRFQAEEVSSHGQICKTVNRGCNELPVSAVPGVQQVDTLPKGLLFNLHMLPHFPDGVHAAFPA